MRGEPCNRISTFDSLQKGSLMYKPRKVVWRDCIDAFEVCWLHAVVQERLRYSPLGWAHQYEFSDADLRVACDTLDTAVDAIAQVSTLIAVERGVYGYLITVRYPSNCLTGKSERGSRPTAMEHPLYTILTMHLRRKSGQWFRSGMCGLLYDGMNLCKQYSKL